MAMDALNNLKTNIPDWVKRLEELNGQIAQRQLDLAKLTESARASSGSGASVVAKSVKNRGSTESLRPKDDPAAYPDDEQAGGDVAPPALEKPKRQTSQRAQPPGSPESDQQSKTPSALQRQTHQVMAVAQAKAKATLRKRSRTDSMISNDNAPKYRTRSMIIVYYDSYVQSFFEELVKFVSAARNLMRKAKMAAKVAQIKKMAELDMQDEEEEEQERAQAEEQSNDPLAPATLTPDAPIEASSKKAGEEEDEELPALRYMSTRQMRQISRVPGMVATSRSPYSRFSARYGGGAAFMSGDLAKQDVIYDELDKGLEAVQSLCERAAHQFLRDGDCNEEIESIKRRLGQSKEMTDKEIERVSKEEPEAAKEEPARTRSFRPQSMRLPTITSPTPKELMADIEVDEGVDTQDESTIPKLVYKSTRAMH